MPLIALPSYRLRRASHELSKASAMAAAEGTALDKVAALLEERAFDQLGATLDEAELEVRRSRV